MTTSRARRRDNASAGIYEEYARKLTHNHRLERSLVTTAGSAKAECVALRPPAKYSVSKNMRKWSQADEDFWNELFDIQIGP